VNGTPEHVKNSTQSLNNMIMTAFPKFHALEARMEHEVRYILGDATPTVTVTITDYLF
jgi:hypothetical protein